MTGWQAARLAAAALVGVGLIAAAASAQDYPTRPIRLIIGFGPGGLGDIAARAMGQVITKSTGQAVVVENMPGAGAANAALALMRSPPDGQTLL